ncbi:hypothetical protein [Lusitaniella coriacea]
MNAQVSGSLSHYSLDRIATKIILSGKITRTDRIWFEAAIRSENPLSTQEQAKIREVFDRLQKGWLQVID